MIKKLKTFLTATAVMFIFVPGAQAYTFTTLDVQDAKATYARGINNSGNVVGTYYDSSWKVHSFRYDSSTDTYTTIDIPGAIRTYANGINDSGDVVGSVRDSSGSHGFIYDGSTDTYTTLDVLGASYTSAFGINYSGDVVGYYRDSSGYHYFIYDGTEYTMIDVPGFAYGINDSGHVVGYYQDSIDYNMRGFVYDGTEYTTLDKPGVKDTSAAGINDSGHIVGFYQDIGLYNRHGFIYDGTEYTTIDVPSVYYNYAQGISGLGDIVGYYQDSSGIHGFIATAEEGDPTWPSGTLDVTIDIKPGSDTNSINLSSAGVIPVAILSSDTFDATMVDPNTVTLAGASVMVVGKSDRYLCSEEDINEDGLIDLVCKVYTAFFMIETGETMAVLEAETYDGTQIRGEDSISIVPDE